MSNQLLPIAYAFTPNGVFCTNDGIDFVTSINTSVTKNAFSSCVIVSSNAVYMANTSSNINITIPTTAQVANQAFLRADGSWGYVTVGSIPVQATLLEAQTGTNNSDFMTPALVVAYAATQVKPVLHQQFFAANGTFTTPAGSTTSTVYKYRMCAAGGGGGGYGGLSTMGSGAGSGHVAEGTFTGVAPSTAITITIGLAGTGGSTSGGNGTAGGSTSIGSPISITSGGGGAGIGSSVGNTPNGGGAGGTLLGGSPTISIPGGKGGASRVLTTAAGNNVEGGYGADCPGWGSGGPGGAESVSASGFAATGFGSGGGGGIESGGAGGGPGAPGACMIEWVL